MLHVTQIFKQPMPDGRLATAVRCTEESSMRMDPREVAAQLDRLCGALASGALSLDGLGAPLKSQYFILALFGKSSTTNSRSNALTAGCQLVTALP